MHTAMALAAQRNRIEQFHHHADRKPTIEPHVTCMMDVQVACAVARSAAVVIQEQTPSPNPAPTGGL